jgi:Tol biopolymer transport system component
MDADGNNVVRLTNTPENENMPSWSPDGKQIAFRVATQGLFVIDADGKNMRQLADAAQCCYSAAQWQPQP